MTVLNEAIKTIKFDIVKLVSTHSTAVPVDWEKFSKESFFQEACEVAAWQCLNGPVGVKKTADFGDHKGICVSTKYGLSSQQWKILVTEVSKSLVVDDNVNYYCKRFGGLWPACENTFIVKRRDK
jgi:hypothetical protein